MEIMRTMPMTFTDYGYVAYQIEFKKEDGKLYQRHVWLTKDGSIEAEEWLRSYSVNV